MKKYTSRLLAALVSAAMLPLPSAPVLAVETPEAEPETDRYEIYPIPHSVEYPASDKFTVSNEVNVVYENDIDQYTKDYLQEILKENGLTATTGSEAVSGKTNILLGVHDSNGAADAWFDANEQLSADLFEKTDAYALDVDQDGNTSVIAIVGKDTDAAFYGLSSLEMMFSSFEGNQLKEVSIEDYADKELRGFIEGFYGGFSYEGRETQIRFLRKVKGNMYVFASKTDPYHGGSNWQAQYPQEELNQIKHLVDVAKASKVRYAWSFHAGKSAFLNGASPQRDSANYGVYQERLAALLAKFQQLYDIGVRDFHILNDDYNSGAPADIALFLNDVNAWLKAKGDCGPLVYCPINYNRTWAAEATVTNELNAYKNNLDDDILLYWTGERVNCPVTQTDIDWVYERSGHEIVNWLNYPCSEHDKAGIYLGNIDFYFSTADNLQHTKGLMSNPVNYPEANKVAYFQLMSWLWNTQNFSENVDTIWKNSFKYIEPEVADSYAVVARHLSNCPDSGRYPGGFPESEDLKESLEALQNRLNSGVPAEDSEEFAAVYDEFKAITAAVADMKANGSEALLSDLNPWLNSLDAVAKAGIAGMDAYTAFSAGDMENAWIHLSKANEEFAKWDDNSPREYADKTAKGGSKRLYPFVKNLLTKMSNEILLNLNPDYNGFTPSVISSFGENPNTQKMIDGDETTFASWNSVQTAGDYYGLDLGRMLNIHDVEIIQGETDTHHDRFHESTLEYSADGENWTPIEENINESRIVRKNLDVRARYIRLRVTGFTDPNSPNKHDFWTRVREFTVNKSANTPAQIYSTQENAGSASIESTDSTVTLKTNSALTLEAGQSIGVKLTDPIFISALQAAQAPSGCVLEYSLDGTTWSSETISGRETVRFARVRNASDAAVLLPADFALNLMKTTGVVPTVTSDLPLKEGSWSALTDGNLTTYAWTSVNQAAGQSIMIDLGRELPFNALSIYMAENRPRLYHGDISVSANGTDWKKVMTVNAADDKTVIDSALRYQRTEGDGTRIRYIRIDVTDSAKEEATEQSAYLKLHEILLNDAPLPEDVPSLFTGTEENMQLAADNDLTTCFEPKAPAGSFEYVIPEKNELPCLTIVQDAENFSNAAVKVLYEGDEEWTDLGTLEKSVNRFALDGAKKALRVRVNWSADQPKPKIYEIVMTGDTAEKSQLSTVLTKAKGIKLSDYALEGQALEQWTSQIRAAQTVYNNTNADQAAVNEAAEDLNRDLLALRLAPDAEKIDALNR